MGLFIGICLRPIQYNPVALPGLLTKGHHGTALLLLTMENLM